MEERSRGSRESLEIRKPAKPVGRVANPEAKRVEGNGMG